MLNTRAYKLYQVRVSVFFMILMLNIILIFSFFEQLVNHYIINLNSVTTAITLLNNTITTSLYINNI